MLQKEKDLLKSFILQKPYEYTVSHPELKLNFWKKIKYKNLIKKRENNIPLAYLTKNKEFFSLNFFVNKNVLIPRPDTEIMIETFLKNLEKNNPKNNILVDVGTGSACIPISILKNTDKIEKTFAIDISNKALRVAKKNSKNHKTDIIFLQSNLLKGFLDKKINLENKNVFITANLPYLTEKQFKNEKSIQAEPKKALVAKEKGLSLYKKLFKEIKLLKAKNIFVFCEIDPDQTEEIKKIISNNFKNTVIEVKKDYGNLDRLIYFTI